MSCEGFFVWVGDSGGGTSLEVPWMALGVEGMGVPGLMHVFFFPAAIGLELDGTDLDDAVGGGVGAGGFEVEEDEGAVICMGKVREWGCQSFAAVLLGAKAWCV